MHVYPYKTEQRLNEAKSALERMRAFKTIYDLNEAFLSFLNATRFALDPLKTDFSKVKDFSDWWTIQAESLNNSELCKFFRDKRNIVIKSGKNPFVSKQTLHGPFKLQGPLQIGPQGILKGIMERGRAVWKPMIVPNTTTIVAFTDVPENLKSHDPFSLCQLYLDMLVKITDEFVVKFCSLK